MFVKGNFRFLRNYFSDPHDFYGGTSGRQNLAVRFFGKRHSQCVTDGAADLAGEENGGVLRIEMGLIAVPALRCILQSGVEIVHLHPVPLRDLRGRFIIGADIGVAAAAVLRMRPPGLVYSLKIYMFKALLVKWCQWVV